MDAKEIIEAAVKRCEPPTRYRLAKRLGITPTSVYQWLSGKHHPSGQHLLEMLRISAERPNRRGRAATLAVLLGTLAGLSGAPQDAEAQTTIDQSRQDATGIHIIRNWLLRLLATWGFCNVRNAPAAIVAI